MTAHLITHLIADTVGPDRIAVRFLLTAYDGAVPADGGPPPARLANVPDGRDESVRTAEGWKLAEKRTKPVLEAG